MNLLLLIGSHGDGHPTNTDTPLVAWGAGIKYPKSASGNSHSDSVTTFVDKHAHDMLTPYDWGLRRVERVDVNQADIAPLMVGLYLISYPLSQTTKNVNLFPKFFGLTFC